MTTCEGYIFIILKLKQQQGKMEYIYQYMKYETTKDDLSG